MARAALGSKRPVHQERRGGGTASQEQCILAADSGSPSERSGGDVYQSQHSVEASRQPGNSPFGLAMSAGGWGILFSSLLILLQLGLLYLVRGNYTLASRNSSLLVGFAALELTCSFCAA